MDHKSANPQQLSQWQSQTPTRRCDEPATQKAGTAELLACLTLVAPSGMTAEDRNAWVQVARETLRGIPGDLLRRGCKKARETCRFASEIVPTILGEVRDQWDWRIRHEAEERAREAARNAPRIEKRRVTGEEASAIVREVFGRLRV